MANLSRKSIFILAILCTLLTAGCSRAAAPSPTEQTAPATVATTAPSVPEEVFSPASYLSGISAENRRCSAEFPPNPEQQYVFTKNQDTHLIWILNRLKPEEFFTGAADGVRIAVTISHNEHPLWLYWDGKITQFAFPFDSTRWAVRNEELNTFFEDLLQYSPENSTYEICNTAPLNELPETYSQEEAAIDKVVILNEGDVRENAALWEEFLKNANARIPSTVRIMKYYSSTDNLQPVKELYDLEFDGDSYYLHYVENGSIRTVHYHYLWNRMGVSAPLESGAQQEYALMCLSNEEITEIPPDLREQDRFARPGDDPFLIWCDYSIRQKQLPMPEEITKITLEVDLRPLITITDPALIHSIALVFSEAEAYFTPKTCFPGPILRFHAPDGTDLSVQLDLEDDLCIFGGQFYHYGKNDRSMLSGLWKLLDLEGWPEEIKTHPAFSYFFENIYT